jgi:hypothetical protein
MANEFATPTAGVKGSSILARLIDIPMHYRILYRFPVLLLTRSSADKQVTFRSLISLSLWFE